jgi:hypothetical protein
VSNCAPFFDTGQSGKSLPLAVFIAAKKLRLSGVNAIVRQPVHFPTPHLIGGREAFPTDEPNQIK